MPPSAKNVASQICQVVVWWRVQNGDQCACMQRKQEKGILHVGRPLLFLPHGMKNEEKEKWPQESAKGGFKSPPTSVCFASLLWAEWSIQCLLTGTTGLLLPRYVKRARSVSVRTMSPRDLAASVSPWTAPAVCRPTISGSGSCKTKGSDAAHPQGDMPQHSPTQHHHGVQEKCIGRCARGCKAHTLTEDLRGTLASPALVRPSQSQTPIFSEQNIQIKSKCVYLSLEKGETVDNSRTLVPGPWCWCAHP